MNTHEGKGSSNMKVAKVRPLTHLYTYMYLYPIFQDSSKSS